MRSARLLTNSLTIFLGRARRKASASAYSFSIVVLALFREAVFWLLQMILGSVRTLMEI